MFIFASFSSAVVFVNKLIAISTTVNLIVISILLVVVALNIIIHLLLKLLLMLLGIGPLAPTSLLLLTQDDLLVGKQLLVFLLLLLLSPIVSRHRHLKFVSVRVTVVAWQVVVIAVCALTPETLKVHDSVELVLVLSYLVVDADVVVV